MRILMIEDDAALCASVKFQLEKQGFDVEVCYNGEDGLFHMLENAHDLVLLDRMLPGLDGLTMLSQARRSGVTTPVILVTALGEIGDRVDGLDAGADDYIVKPFAFEELYARIRSALRRPRSWADEHLLSLGDISYNSVQNILSNGALSCSLSPREGALLEVFLRNPGQTIPRSLILSRVWGPESDVEAGNLDNYIYFLRRRLKTVQSGLSIKSVRGVGYRLEEEDA